jgi:putative hemolysin
MLYTIFIAFFFTAFFSGTEIAYISANKLLVELKRKRNSGTGNILAYFYESPARFLGAMLVGHNIALIVFTILVSELLKPYLEHFIHSEILLSLITTVLITLLILIVAEYLPKTVFKMYADRILFNLAYPIRFFQFLLAIPTWLITKMAGFVLKIFFKTGHEPDEIVFTRGDLEHFVNTNFKNTKQEEEVDTDLFQKTLQLRNVKVKHCMVPRAEMIYMDITDGVAELRRIFRETNLSRVIVVRNHDIDDILGYVHHQQMLKAPESVEPLVMEMEVVPEVMRVMDLLEKLVQSKTNILCVVDEFGGTTGIVTLEDVLEQIFGDIEDEHDHEEYVETKINDNEYIFSGRLEMDYINEMYPLFRLPKSEYHTLSGYLVNAVTAIPEQGVPIELEGFRFIPELVSDTRIETVRIIRLHAPEQK